MLRGSAENERSKPEQGLEAGRQEGGEVDLASRTPPPVGEKRHPLSRTSVGRVVLRRADQPLEKTLDQVKR